LNLQVVCHKELPTYHEPNKVVVVVVVVVVAWGG